jgi:hypothetical protein
VATSPFRFHWALLFLACAVACSCSPKRENEPDWRRRVVTEAALPLPAGARVVQFYAPDSFVDPIWAARIEIPIAALETIKATIAAKTADSTHVSDRFANTVSWWQPEETLLTKQYLANRQTLVNVVLSMEHRGPVAYVECMIF